MDATTDKCRAINVTLPASIVDWLDRKADNPRHMKVRSACLRDVLCTIMEAEAKQPAPTNGHALAH